MISKYLDYLLRLQKMHYTLFMDSLTSVSSHFNNTADLILLVYDRSPISRMTIPEAVVIQLVLLRMSCVLLETCWGV